MDWGHVNFLVAIVVATLWAAEKNDKMLPGKKGIIIRFCLGFAFGLIPGLNLVMAYVEIHDAVTGR